MSATAIIRVPQPALETLEYCIEDGLQEIAACRASQGVHRSISFLLALNRLEQARVRLQAIDADIAEQKRIAGKGGAS